MLTEIPDDVQAELDDEKYSTRKHYSRATYALGCRGPLCRKAERDRGRTRNQQKALENGREYKPNVDLRIADDDQLDDIVEFLEVPSKAEVA